MFDLLIIAIAFFAGWVMVPSPEWADAVRIQIITKTKELFSKLTTPSNKE